MSDTNKELIVNVEGESTKIALLENKKLVEYHIESDKTKFSVGDIFLAKVGKLSKGLNASFVNLKYKKDGFLHYQDLGVNINSMLEFVKNSRNGKNKKSSLDKSILDNPTKKDGVIADVLKTGDEILVQIKKEPISTKGPRLSSEISIAGRYMILIPFSNKIMVSQKIKSEEERFRLKKIIESIKPKGFGVIIRTVAENKKVIELDGDIVNLMEKWDECFKLFSNKKNKPSLKVFHEMNRASSILRDLFDDKFSNIYCDDKEFSIEVRNYLEEIAPDKLKIVKDYDSDIPIMEKFGVEKQIKISFGKNVYMQKGASLVIEHTEAMNVIDVNSGGKTSAALSQEENALQINMLSAKEIAIQLRLRDMGGIIIVDFIDMKKAENRTKVYKYMVECMDSDKAKHKILPLTKFGLLQITRQRIRPVTEIKTREKNPNNIINVESPISIIDNIEQHLVRILPKNKKIVLHAHPFICAYLTQNIPSIRQKWFIAYRRWVKIIPRNAFDYFKYEFHDEKGNVID